MAEKLPATTCMAREASPGSSTGFRYLPTLPSVLATIHQLLAALPVVCGPLAALLRTHELVQSGGWRLMCFTFAKNKKLTKPGPLCWILAYIKLESSK